MSAESITFVGGQVAALDLLFEGEQEIVFTVSGDDTPIVATMAYHGVLQPGTRVYAAVKPDGRGRLVVLDMIYTAADRPLSDAEKASLEQRVRFPGPAT